MEKNKPIIYAKTLREYMALRKKHPKATVKMKSSQQLPGQQQLFDTEEYICV